MRWFATETQRHRESRRESPFSVSLRLCGVLALAVSCTGAPPGEIENKPDEPRPREAQSDFLDIGKQAGIEWLSFVPNDQREFPELFEGLDRDQKRHVRLAPLERPDERVLIEFKLPLGGKLRPVDWYGTELMAIDLPEMTGLSLALATDTGQSETQIKAMAGRRGSLKVGSGTLGLGPAHGAEFVWSAKNEFFVYRSRALKSRTLSVMAVLEWAVPKGQLPFSDPPHELTTDPVVKQTADRMGDLLVGISIRRDLALEGSPKHKCTSSIDELQHGKLVFPGGTLSLPLKDGQIARKVGGDSTIQVDGEGAKPWLILRRLKDSGAPGDIRARVRSDTTFARRVEKPSSRFSAGRRLENGAIVWDYADDGAEQQLVGVIATGKELLTVEVVSQGLRDGQARRDALAAALKLVGGATLDAAGEPLKVLEGWNVGTMGRDK